MSNARPRVVLLAGRGDSTNIVYNALIEVADVVAVVEEAPPSKRKLLARRAKKVGLLAAADQVLFIAVASRILKKSATQRAKQIHEELGLKATSPPQAVLKAVPSVNSDVCMQVMKEANPDVVVVNGTRIISQKVLDSVAAPFINTHAGITPAYRGVHGGYWALAEGRPELCGVTVHYVDAGIDTGAVIAQATIAPTEADNFYTYPLLQLGAALPLLKKAVPDTFQNGLQTQAPLTRESRLYYHPGITRYLRSRVTSGVR